ncbi:MAG TPA: hypothetical protein VF535_16410 [Allosphingosinicella sp.]|jgi:hypothetical protein
MPTSAEHELADRLTRRRARMMPALAALFLAGQPFYFARNQIAIDTQIKTAVWLAWAAILLLALAMDGGHFRGRAVRDLVEDEVTRANRLRAYAAGFWAAMATVFGIYGLSVFDNIQGRESLHLIMTFSLAAALITFGMLEKRALRDG